MGDPQLKRTKGEPRNGKGQHRSWVRASISFSSDVYESLDEISKLKMVSLVWVVREAAEIYISEKVPSLRKSMS